MVIPPPSPPDPPDPEVLDELDELELLEVKLGLSGSAQPIHAAAIHIEPRPKKSKL
jgi:hypothetical protein